MCDIIPQRICKKCGQSKPLASEYFHKDKKAAEGFCYRCKECANTRAREWHYDNQELANQRSRERYYTHPEEVAAYRTKNAERIAQQKREWRQNNPDKVAEHKKRDAKKRRAAINAYHREWYKQNRKRLIAAITPEQRRKASQRACAWAKANPEKALSYFHKRRALKYGNGGEGYTQADKDLQLRSQKGLCWWCGVPMGDDITEDHLIPLNRGGKHDPRNIVLCHLSCNCSKKDKLPHEWIGRLF